MCASNAVQEQQRGRRHAAVPPLPAGDGSSDEGSGQQQGSSGQQQRQMFQQSVTLTVRMWDETNGTAGASKDGGGWWWGAWRVPTEYLPLLIALCCGIAIVLLVLSALVVWRCCIVPRKKHEYCDGVFCEVSSHCSQNGFDTSKSFPKETAVYAMHNGPWAYHSRLINSTDSLYSVPRSQTMASIPTRSCSLHDSNGTRRYHRPSHSTVTKEVTMVIPAVMSEFLVPRGDNQKEGLTPSHSDEVGLDDDVISYSEKAKSTPTLEDIYAKVNFSKKKKNRMRKDEAAIIALSKSRTELDCDSLSIPSHGAVVVYNERTAL